MIYQSDFVMAQSQSCHQPSTFALTSQNFRQMPGVRSIVYYETHQAVKHSCTDLIEPISLYSLLMLLKSHSLQFMFLLPLLFCISPFLPLPFYLHPFNFAFFTCTFYIVFTCTLFTFKPFTCAFFTFAITPLPFTASFYFPPFTCFFTCIFYLHIFICFADNTIYCFIFTVFEI